MATREEIDTERSVHRDIPWCGWNIGRCVLFCSQLFDGDSSNANGRVYGSAWETDKKFFPMRGSSYLLLSASDRWPRFPEIARSSSRGRCGSNSSSIQGQLVPRRDAPAHRPRPPKRAPPSPRRRTVSTEEKREREGLGSVKTTSEQSSHYYAVTTQRLTPLSWLMKGMAMKEQRTCPSV